MPRFLQVSAMEAAPDVHKVYRSFSAKMGFPEIPSFITTLGGAPALAAGTACLIEHLMLEGALPRTTKELIFLAVAADRECEYCAEAHAACCRMLGIEEELIEAVRRGLNGDLPEDVHEILLFAIKCAAAPEELTNADFEYLRRQDLSQAQILEVIATSALAVYTTIIADSTLLEPDTMFAAQSKA